tara:strand:- start:1030 stop:1221 length:192 start_codon:yes stop_codon:yes gene_type:complete
MQLSEVIAEMFTEAADCHAEISELKELVRALRLDNEMLAGQIYELEEQITGRILSGPEGDISC